MLYLRNNLRELPLCERRIRTLSRQVSTSFGARLCLRREKDFYMTGTKKGIVLLLVVLGVLVGATGIANVRAEPTYLVYPSVASIFRYDPVRYELLSPGDIGFAQSYSLGNKVLWDKVEERVPVEIYRAPGLAGFEPSPSYANEFYAVRNEFNLIIDGFSESPHVASNLYIRFEPVPYYASPRITVDRQTVTSLTFAIPPLAVTTLIEEGYYSDTRSHHIMWSGTAALRIVIFSDRDGDGVLDGEQPIYSVFVQDNVIATEETTWGGLKAQYGGR